MTGLVFRDPEGDTWETADAYLSGNVRQELQTAEAAAAVSAEFTPNVAALRKVQPTDLEPATSMHAWDRRGFLFPISVPSSAHCFPLKKKT